MRTTGLAWPFYPGEQLWLAPVLSISTCRDITASVVIKSAHSQEPNGEDSRHSAGAEKSWALEQTELQTDSLPAGTLGLELASWI